MDYSVHNAKASIVEDVKREPMIYNLLITRSIALDRVCAGETKQNEAVGVLLPNISAVAHLPALWLKQRLQTALGTS